MKLEKQLFEVDRLLKIVAPSRNNEGKISIATSKHTSYMLENFWDNLNGNLEITSTINIRHRGSEPIRLIEHQNNSGINNRNERRNAACHLHLNPHTDLSWLTSLQQHHLAAHPFLAWLVWYRQCFVEFLDFKST